LQRVYQQPSQPCQLRLLDRGPSARRQSAIERFSSGRNATTAHLRLPSTSEFAYRRHREALGSPCFIHSRTPSSWCQGLSRSGAGISGCAACVPISSHTRSEDPETPIGSMTSKCPQRDALSANVAVLRQASTRPPLGF